jgi:hypothetical protein
MIRLDCPSYLESQRWMHLLYMNASSIHSPTHFHIEWDVQIAELGDSPFVGGIPLPSPYI